MKNLTLQSLFSGLVIFILFGCGGMSFNDQITNDLSTKMGTGICDSIPKGASISNIQIGEIVPIGDSGLIDVSYELDYEKDSVKKHHKGALLYSKKGSSKKLERIGGCEYGKK